MTYVVISLAPRSGIAGLRVGIWEAASFPKWLDPPTSNVWEFILLASVWSSQWFLFFSVFNFSHSVRYGVTSPCGHLFILETLFSKCLLYLPGFSPTSWFLKWWAALPEGVLLCTAYPQTETEWTVSCFSGSWVFWISPSFRRLLGPHSWEQSHL